MSSSTRAATVIARIGIDHQALLGATAAAITAHKAGIMRPGVPCVVDPANRSDPAIADTLEAHARTTGTPPLLYADPASVLPPGFSAPLEPHQLANLACAYAAFRVAMGEAGLPQTPEDGSRLASVVQKIRWPGRLQQLDIGPLLPGPSRHRTVLLDGAHNPQSAEVLAAHVEKQLRSGGRPVTWILAASAGKDLRAILGLLLRPGDRVAAVRFGPVDGMPWVRATSPQSILDAASALGVRPEDQLQLAPAASPTLPEALAWATAGDDEAERPVAIAGSLYLVSETLRQLRQAGGATGLPG